MALIFGITITGAKIQSKAHPECNKANSIWYDFEKRSKSKFYPVGLILLYVSFKKLI
ncbi:hypothetical protein PBT90_07950 [Algoriphagus halophytocola]|uniref:Uncharacterized protein n=1 Tax=Algoriphagus halophytocola TaxID=2991499 RepID=A0ABY6MHP9_9BACT|nr:MULTISPECIES: hypothetical protein [unclassified Algoriphagus]UZD23318.1 hypothetical protein OM944_02260 [Algoriphagus sp. TR-M5]WBL44613.1 hypothetical protein PBT90_07950 [Algoriphagus sp. TR-M9]